MSQTLVRTRMAPSPTGDIHVGSMATLLKNYAFAKHHEGKFVLRIEDTDQAREVEGGVKQILNVIKEYGLSWDEGPEVGGPHAPYIQSERLDLYTKYADQLVKMDMAYHCFCSKERLEKVREKQRAAKQPPGYDGHCRHLSQAEVEAKLAQNTPHVIRLKVPRDQNIEFTDLIRGKIVVNSNEVGDQVLLKSDGFPTYHLAVVVDDHLMEITHIMRGEEWISSTPKHVLLYQAFGWSLPTYAHIPVFLNPDGKGKMSKRKGTVSAQSFLDRGYLPEALLNFFMILGWASSDQREILSLEEYIEEFDPKDISPKSVAFDIKKLQWLNGVYIRKLSREELRRRLQPFLPTDYPKDLLEKVLPLIFERLVTLADIDELTDFFYKEIMPDTTQLIKKSSVQDVTTELEKTIAELKNIEQWNTSAIEEKIRTLQETNDWKRGQYFMMLRIAVTGRAHTPPLFETIEVLSKKITLSRLQHAYDILT